MTKLAAPQRLLAASAVAVVAFLTAPTSSSAATVAPGRVPDRTLAYAVAAPAKRVVNIVQLGDSYSAGNGAGSYHGPKDCYRSTKNWGSLYTKYLNDHNYSATYVNVACSGGKTIDIIKSRRMEPIKVGVSVPPRSKPSSPTVTAALKKKCLTPAGEPGEVTATIAKDVTVQPVPRTSAYIARGTCTRVLRPQVETVSDDTDLVLLTTGGNDIDFEGIVEKCFWWLSRAPTACRDRIDDANTHLPQTKAALKTALAAIHARNQNTRVTLLTYPYLCSLDSWVLRRAASINRAKDEYDACKNVRALGDAGDRMQQEAVKETNMVAGKKFVTIVDQTKVHFAGHEPNPAAFELSPWILSFTLPKAVSYHPNGKGHEEEKDLIVDHGGGVTAVNSTSAKNGSIDLVFVIDTTGSMQPSIDAVKALSNQMVDLLVKQTDSYRFGLVTYRDDPGWTSGPEDYPARVDLNFTTNAKAIHAALATMAANGGGDTPETVYSGLDAAYNLTWRAGVKKVVIQIGDAPPHDPEPVSGLTGTASAEHSLALDPAEIYPVDVSGSAPGPELTELARRTGGVPQSTAVADLGTILIKTITRALNKPFAWAGGPYVAKVGESVDLDARGSYDPDGTIVKYEWDFDGNGTFEQTTTTPVRTHVWKAPQEGKALAVRVTDNDGESSVGTAHLAITVDGDEVPAAEDNCPKAANPGQDDYDKDGVGDECDDTPGYPTADAEGVFPADDPAAVSKSVISGAVFADTDGDGRRDTTEDGVEGVTIALTGTDSFGGTVGKETTTDGTGAWSFGGLMPGTYQVIESQPSDVADGVDSLGEIHDGGPTGSPGTLGPDAVSGIVVDLVGASAVGYGFGERPASGGWGLWRFLLVGLVALLVAAAAVVAFVHLRGRARRPVLSDAAASEARHSAPDADEPPMTE